MLSKLRNERYRVIQWLFRLGHVEAQRFRAAVGCVRIPVDQSTFLVLRVSRLTIGSNSMDLLCVKSAPNPRILFEPLCHTVGIVVADYACRDFLKAVCGVCYGIALI